MYEGTTQEGQMTGSSLSFNNSQIINIIIASTIGGNGTPLL